ncbi:hypothetical protein QM646_45830, partial [Rhodococcus erythropolis]|nr:hypothetical protein [Rhodococcus erythropolis]
AMYRCPFSPAFATISSGDRASIGEFAGGATCGATGSATGGGVDSTMLGAASGVAAGGLVASADRDSGAAELDVAAIDVLVAADVDSAALLSDWLLQPLRSRPAAATQR